MNSIGSLKLDFNSQIEQLNKIQNEKMFEECIYIGSGDSFVAGLIAEYLTQKCKCYSPSDLANSRLQDDKTYCFISVTGKTKANIEIALRAQKAGLRTAAVTANEKSKLAQICDQVIPLNITRIKTQTAGFCTFVANVITCLQLSGVDVPSKFDLWHKNAVEISSKILKSLNLPDHVLYILGNNLLYPLALYTSFQMAEFFGTTAVPHKLEEFCHSTIFGLKKSHSVWILGQNEKICSSRIEELGVRSSYIELYNSDMLSQVFQSIFILQSLMLLLAERYEFTELQYLEKKDILKVSSDLIYDVDKV